MQSRLRYWLLLFAFCFLLFPATRVHAQIGLEGTSNWRSRTISTRPDSLSLDSVSISPGSLTIEGISTTDYTFDPYTSILKWKMKPPLDSVRLRYRALPISITRQFFHKDRRLIDSIVAFNYTPGLHSATNPSSFVEFSPLEYTGSYGRSISMGNNQDAALQSNFNLQANGYLPDSIRLEAAISDNTLPFQPEGNTQRLQEFDQVYIRLTKRQHLLQIGDYNIERPKGYFLSFNKRVQGLYYGSGFRLGRLAANSFGVSGSVSKGEFARNIFMGTEGNQGPYKLTGNNGEQFFIVLAGTERVYINGLIQERGENADYTINYNTGEIRFMPRRLISKDSRIQVEFEYQSRSFLNSLIYAWDEAQIGKKWNVHLNVYSNQDARNQGYTQNLSGEQKRFLSTIGDSIGNAYYPVIATDTFAPNKILYKIIDTVVAGILYDSVFVYSTSRDSARFSLSFSYVGPNRGDYVISTRAANGRVYDWVPPVGGHPLGDYAPVQLLITPKMQQVITLATNYQIDSFKALNIELASSNYDPNLFSKTDNNTHWGLASKLRYAEQRFLGKKDSAGTTPWRWQNEATYEYVQDRFRAIAPYRNVEFGRDWNVPPQDTRKPDEHLAGYTTSLTNRHLGTASYAFGYYGRGSDYTGYRNVLSYGIDKTRWRTGISLNLTRTEDTFKHSRFFRPSAVVEYRMPKLNASVVGAQFEQEDNRIYSQLTDTLRFDAYRFSIASAYLRTPEARPFRYALTYTQRRDELPRANALLLQSHSHNIDLRLGVARSQNHLISLTSSFRKLIVDDTIFNNQRGEETGLGRLEYTGNLLKGAVQLQTLYETGAGQEQKRTYTYVEVPAGQGFYYWVDYNADGVQQANEFEIGLYPDQKKFVRVFTPTNEYVRVNYVTFNQSISFDPAVFFNPIGIRPWQKFVSRFSDQGSLQITNRLAGVSAGEAVNPFTPALRDDHIIIAGTSVSNTAFFNRSSTIWGLDYTYVHNTSKQLLTYGVEGYTNRLNTARLRWNFTPFLSTNIQARKGLRGYESALSDGRTYAVHSNGVEPSLVWLYRSAFRLTTTYRYEDRKNDDVYGGEHAVINRVDLEARYSKPVSGVLLVRAGYAGITYTGLTTTSVSFTILDALLPGANFLWYANWDRRVSKGIELSLEYEGRKPATGTAVHTGRMSIRAIL
jgi:hypothetical protein